MYFKPPEGRSKTGARCSRSHIIVLLSLPQERSREGSVGHQLTERMPSVWPLEGEDGVRRSVVAVVL